MQIATTRFGTIQIDVEDIVLFPLGLIGFEDRRHWVILGDTENDAVGWLQCVSQADLALAFVSPRRFTPDYQVRVQQTDLVPLQLAAVDQAFVMAVISKGDTSLTVNLRAPIIINLDRNLGRQVITTDDQPIQHDLAPLPTPVTVPLRKSA